MAIAAASQGTKDQGQRTREAYAAARDVCRAHAKSFYFASHFLPIPKRRHAYAVYAFCRLLDDAVDEAPPDQQAAGVAGFREALDSAYCDSLPPSPVMAAFAHTVRVCDIPRAYFDDLVHGVTMDLTPARFDTWQQLETYCYHVAGVVGLMMTRVLGLRDRRVETHAIAMGNAMQLTNILRDVAEDLRRGRVYLPREDLARSGLTENDLHVGVVDDRWRSLMQFEIARARRFYAAASRGLEKLDPDGSRLTAAVMAGTYSGILDAIEAADYDVFSRRVHLSTRAKIGRLPVALQLAND